MLKKVLSTTLSAILILSAMTTGAVSADEPTFNYGEALQKSIFFYEFQRSGELPDDKRDNWRGDSALSDGADVGLDLSGGLYDAGDHVKFNLPMAYTSTMLAWAVHEDKQALEESGQLSYTIDTIKWVTDYLIKCHPEANVFYYQVGDGNKDHSWWGPAEVMQMERPSYKVDLSNPGSTVSGEAAAALASAALVFKDIDADYSSLLLKHAKELFAFADTTKSDKGYTAANSFYTSHSGFYDQLSWAATWLYLASDDDSYLDKAESYVQYWGTEPQSNTIAYKWAHCWDDTHNGTALLLAKITNKDIYITATEMHLDYWTTGYNGERVGYTPDGLAWLDSWGALRYATTTAFLAGVYADWDNADSQKAQTYKNFTKQQVDYALGSTGRSYVVGFGENSPEHPHHRTAHSSYTDSLLNPSEHRHVIYGALVGGPNKDGSYSDDVTNYVNNEVANDYNAGFVGALTKMYKWYGGEPIENLNAIEEITNDEFFVEAGINAYGQNFIEIKALIYNMSGWPARMGDKLSFKYFIDISEGIQNGYSAADYSVSTNYNAGATVSSKLIPWDEANNLYYVDVDFTGTKIYPGGQSAYRKEVQFRISAPLNTQFWDNSNDFSYTHIDGQTSGKTIKTANIPVYDDGVKVFGNEPENAQSNAAISPKSASFDKYLSAQKDVEVNVNYNDNTLSSIKNGTYTLKENSDYLVSGDKIIISKSYLSTLSVGETQLTFTFSGGAAQKLTITVSDSTPSASVKSDSASFDKYLSAQKDVEVSVTYNGHTLSSIKNGTYTLKENSDYLVSGDKIIISKSYLSTLSVGETQLTFVFSGGAAQKLTIAVSDSTPSASIVQSSASFDKAAVSHDEIKVDVVLNGHELSGITLNGQPLDEGADYTFAEDSVVFAETWLDTLAVGEYKITFDFSAGNDSVFTLKVVDSSIVVTGEISVEMFNGNKSPSTNGMMPRFKLINTGDEAVDFKDIQIRYYYTIDGEKAQNFWCDWSSIGSQNVKARFVKLETPVDGADYYLEITFTDAAGKLLPNQSAEVQARFSKFDWTNYNQENDYSFNKNANSYETFDKVTVFIDDVLVFGVQP